MRIDEDLVAASATTLVLAVLAEGDSYGYAIARRVRDLSAVELGWADGMLYPLLHRLRRLGYVTTEWRPRPEGGRRRYYAVTGDGRKASEAYRRQRVRLGRGVGDVWRGCGGLLAALGDANHRRPAAPSVP